jgi:hypothetical protein
LLEPDDEIQASRGDLAEVENGIGPFRDAQAFDSATPDMLRRNLSCGEGNRPESTLSMHFVPHPDERSGGASDFVTYRAQ